MFKRPFLLPRVRRTALEHVEGRPILVSPDLLNPVVFRSGEWFARSLARLLPAAPGRLLDMGTGSGVCAVFAAQLGYEVTAVDLNSEAVRFARINALLNSVEIDVRQGDLFEPVRGGRFEFVLFNPPFFRGEPRSPFDMAWRGTDVLERFAAGLGSALSPGGRGFVLLSSDGDAVGMLDALSRQGMKVSVAERRHFGSEVMTIYEARPE
jgi:release factor glutamine methyltransferase